MARLHFTPQLRRFLEFPDVIDVAGDTLRAVLDAAFAGRPRLRGYILDERGTLRQHVSVFVDGALARDRRDLTDAVGPGSEVYVLQALSGG